MTVTVTMTMVMVMVAMVVVGSWDVAFTCLPTLLVSDLICDTKAGPAPCVRSAVDTNLNHSAVCAPSGAQSIK